MPVVSKNPTLAAFGRLGGLSRSDAKRAAVRENGKRGGRPKDGPFRRRRNHPPSRKIGLPLDYFSVQAWKRET